MGVFILMVRGKPLDLLIKFSQSRLAWAMLALSAISLECTALFFQYGLHLSPCLLCVYQRVAILGLLIAGVIGWIKPTGFNRYIAFAIWGISAFWGMNIAMELVAIQADPSPFATCDFLPNFPQFFPLHQWFPSVFMPTGMCTDDVWDLWGLSMAEWMQVVFGIYIAVFLLFCYPILSTKSDKNNR